MLTNLSVKNLALFKDVSMELDEGLNIMTGETGAGKSILIGSVLLALGGRYTADMLRNPDKPGYVELTFTVEDEAVLKALCEVDADPDLSDGMMIITRRFNGNRSTSRINGETVTQKKLRACASLLLDVYGQHDAQILLDEGGPGQLLDDYAGEALFQTKRETAEACKALSEVRSRIRSIGSDEAQRLREMDLLSYELQEIEEAGLREGEDEELENEYARLTNAQQIMDSLAQAREALNSGTGGAGAADMISRAVREIAGIRSYDEMIGGFYEQLIQIDELMSDVSREIGSYADGFEVSGEEIDRIGARLDLINHLKSKYGPTISVILSEAAKRQERLDVLADANQTLEALSAREEELTGILRAKCDLLSKARMKYARLMEEEIAACLTDLNFADNRFEIRINQTDNLTADGCDEITFFIGPNPGEPMRELSRIASGGELSRIMLAVKTVMAGREGGKTLIFDEIDSGISGRTAGAVARKLSVIAGTHQVLCITHLAQIAAMADRHYRIEKSIITSDGNTETVTSIDSLDRKGEIEELARIMAGSDVTRTSLENAKEMKDLAETYKKENTLRSF